MSRLSWWSLRGLLEEVGEAPAEEQACVSRGTSPPSVRGPVAVLLDLGRDEVRVVGAWPVSGNAVRVDLGERGIATVLAPADSQSAPLLCGADGGRMPIRSARMDTA